MLMKATIFKRLWDENIFIINEGRILYISDQGFKVDTLENGSEKTKHSTQASQL